MSMTKTVALILALVFVLGTALSLFRFTDWWVRVWDYPRPQIAIFGALLLLMYLWQWDPRQPREIVLLVLLAVSLVYQGLRILPYTPLYPVQVQRAPAETEATEGAALSVLIANVYMENRQSQPLLDLVDAQSPDVVFVVETDSWWQQQLQVLSATHPYSLQHPLPNTYGMLLFSRLPLLDPRVEFLVADDIPSMHTDILLPSGRRVRFHGLHPRPPSPTEAPDSVERDGELLQVAMRVRDHDGPSLVVGDLNDVAWSSSTSLMQRVGGLLDPRVGRGLYSTFHAKIPFLRWPLDHAFHTDHFLLLDLRRLPAIGSDHFPVLVHLLLTEGARLQQEAPETEPEDFERADEKIEEALEEEQEKEQERDEQEREEQEPEPEGAAPGGRR